VSEKSPRIFMEGKESREPARPSARIAQVFHLPRRLSTCHSSLTEAKLPPRDCSLPSPTLPSRPPTPLSPLPIPQAERENGALTFTPGVLSSDDSRLPRKLTLSGPIITSSRDIKALDSCGVRALHCFEAMRASLSCSRSSN
jgi:hypothetical protein